MAAAAAAVGLVAVVSLHRPVSSAAGPGAARPPTAGRSNGRAAGSTTTTSPPTGPLRSATGKAEQFGFGLLAAKVTVRGSHIVDVSVVQLQTADPTSQSIAAQAIPMLKSEVLSAQTARIYGISGATYTSEGYALSVQSALDQLHVK
jgi:uncharacterized protein with FMN-binding domain